MPDRSFYEALSHDQLIARLKVAEDALVLIGWSSTLLGDPRFEFSERAKAAEQMWSMWCGMVGLAFCDPGHHADLDAMVPGLAADRDRIRSDTLRRFGDDGHGQAK